MACRATRRARATWRKESLAFHRELANPRGIGINLALLAWCAATDGRYERAGRLLGVLRTFTQVTGEPAGLGVPVSGYRHLSRYHAECQAEILRALGDSGLDAAVRRGAGLSVGDALAYAMQEDGGRSRRARPRRRHRSRGGRPRSRGSSRAA